MKISTLKLLKARFDQSIENIVEKFKEKNKKKIAIFGPVGAFTAYALSNIINPPVCYASVEKAKPTFFEEMVQRTNWEGKIDFFGGVNGEEVSTGAYHISNNGNFVGINPELNMTVRPSEKFSVWGSVSGEYRSGRYSNPKNSHYAGEEYAAEIGLGLNLKEWLKFKIGVARRWEDFFVDYSNIETNVRQDLHGTLVGFDLDQDSWSGSFTYRNLDGRENFNVGFGDQELGVKEQELKAEAEAHLKSWTPYLKIIFKEIQLPDSYRDSKDTRITAGGIFGEGNLRFFIEGSYGIKTTGDDITNRYYMGEIGLRGNLGGNNEK